MKRILQIITAITLLISLNSCGNMGRTLGTMGRTMGRSGGQGVYYH